MGNCTVIDVQKDDLVSLNAWDCCKMVLFQCHKFWLLQDNLITVKTRESTIFASVVIHVEMRGFTLFQEIKLIGQ